MADPTFVGIASILDTDLYKLTMQCAVLRKFPTAEATYELTNRTPDLKLSRRAFTWFQSQVSNFVNLKLTNDERIWLKEKINLPDTYIDYLSSFRFTPSEEVELTFTPTGSGSGEDELGDLKIHLKGLWVKTILYEVPLLALLSEAYFKFVDTDWSMDGQVELAKKKGLDLITSGCVFSEFGTRRRRSYGVQVKVLEGLIEAQREQGGEKGAIGDSVDKPAGTAKKGRFTGSSNVHFAHVFGLDAIGTVAHEWTMGIAAYTGSYENANELSLQYWIETFGPGLFSIALTDTFGTETFLRAFWKKYPALPGTHLEPIAQTKDLMQRYPDKEYRSSYAEIWQGVRQDSGDPEKFVKLMKDFYKEAGVSVRKTIVFSDSLTVETAKKYKQLAESNGFDTVFGVGTFLTNDFHRSSNPSEKSKPLNIVIKISSVNGKPAIKLSDDPGKHTGDKETIEEVKKELHYVEREGWNADEADRWGGK